MAQQNGGRGIGDFNRATRQSIFALPALSGSSGQASRIQLPQTGFLAGLWCLFSGTTTTAAASSTTVATYVPPPFGVVPRIRIFNNQGVEVWNTSAWGAYLYNGTLRTGFDQAVDHSDFVNAGGTSPFTRYFDTAATLGASATDDWRFALYLPIAWGPSLQAGLQLAQDPAITWTLEVTWGTTSDLYSATTGTVTLSALQTQVMCELYAVPAQAADLPKLSYTKTVLEDITTITTGSGDNTYKVVTGNMLTRVIEEFANGSTLAPIASSAFTQRRLRYSQTQVPYQTIPDLDCFRQRFLYDRDLPIGVYVHELSTPMGTPELVGTRDIINTARLTDLDLITTLSGVALAGTSQRRTIREQLVANR